MFNFEEELKKLPRKPGVYIMRDDKDVILYVGKAINLHNRVRSYFRENIGRGPAIDQMVSLIARFEYIVTDSELEALVLENNLIKENSPKYNTLLKDDKTYPYIKVTVGEDYPRILFSRTMKKDKSRYFGPYTSAAAVKDTIELLNKLYQLRTCNRVLPRDTGLERPCLNYHIKQCLAPCQGYVSKEEYRQQVAGALEFLNGNYSPILKDLEEKMNRVIAILPKIQGKKGILHMESVATESNTFEEELEQEEVTAENWNGGYDEDGNYTGDGEYDEDGNYVGAKPKTALEEAIENWNGGYDEEGDYTGAGEYDESGNYVGPKPTQESLDAASDESGDGSGDESSADDQSSETSEDGESDSSYDDGNSDDSDGYGDYTEDNSDYQGDDSEGY